VEIGVQSIFDDVLKKVKRGHGVKATIKATQLLKDAGFKVCYHLMPNLPGSNLQRDFQMFKRIFNDPRFKPDMIKIYPCVVCYQAELYQWYQKKKFIPYSDQDLIDLLVKIKKIVPQWVRINRLGRDIPVANIAAGNKLSNIRQVLQSKLKEQRVKCCCIRCREVRENKIENCKPGRSTSGLKIENYRASGGLECFLQFVDKSDRLYALLRLRIKKKQAIVRELHTYGEALAIGKKSDQASQHQGLGRQLLIQAEKIARKAGKKKISVIAGVGAREYYHKLGYRLKDTYMVKSLK
jgi:elongator complex protein 3